MPIDRQISTPPDSFVPRAQRDALTSTLLRARAGGVSSQTQRELVREIVECITISRRSPEQCVVAFKALLNEAAVDAGFPLGRDRASLQERFVSLFIEELYQATTSRSEDDACRGKTGGRITPAGSLESPGAHP